MMKKYTAFFALAITLSNANSAVANIMFGNDNQNQFGLYIGGAFHLSEGEERAAPLFINAHYAQPTEILRLPARLQVEASTMLGHGVQWSMVGASLDAALFSYGRFYAGVGLGAAYRDTTTIRLGSRFTFSQKAFIGYRMTESFSVEIFGRHFSNGELTEQNDGYNLLGLAALVNF